MEILLTLSPLAKTTPLQPLSDKRLGKLKYFLRIEIVLSNSSVVMSERNYILDILEETSMLDCKFVDTPMDLNIKLVPRQEKPRRDPRIYR